MLWGQNWPNNRQVSHMAWPGGAMPGITLIDSFHVFIANNKVNESQIFNQFYFRSLCLCTVCCVLHQWAIASSPAQLCIWAAAWRFWGTLPILFNINVSCLLGENNFPNGWLNKIFQIYPGISLHMGILVKQKKITVFHKCSLKLSRKTNVAAVVFQHFVKT